MEIETFKLPFGTYEGKDITSKEIPRRYLERLEEDLLTEKKLSTNTKLMQALDKELRRRKK